MSLRDEVRKLADEGEPDFDIIEAVYLRDDEDGAFRRAMTTAFRQGVRAALAADAAHPDRIAVAARVMMAMVRRGELHVSGDVPALAAWDALDAAVNGTPAGTMHCPICGADGPHRHRTEEIEAWHRATGQTKPVDLDPDGPPDARCCFPHPSLDGYRCAKLAGHQRWGDLAHEWWRFEPQFFDTAPGDPAASPVRCACGEIPMLIPEASRGWSEPGADGRKHSRVVCDPPDPSPVTPPTAPAEEEELARRLAPADAAHGGERQEPLERRAWREATADFVKEIVAILREATEQKWTRTDLVEDLTALLEERVADPAPVRSRGKP